MDVKLVMFKSSGQRKDLPVKELTVIGRSEDCNLQIPLVSVSRRHCEIRIDGESVSVKDLASSNGTYVNNRRVNETLIVAGDRIAVGPIVFTLQVNGQPEEIQPIKTRGQKIAEAKARQEEAIVIEHTELTPVSDSDKEEDMFAALDLAEEESEDDVIVDPIAALEALAAESDKEDKE